MGKIVLGVTVSLDGFAEDSSGRIDPLYPDLETLVTTEVMKESIRNTGAVVMAWKEFAMAEDPDWYAGNYEYQTPIFVVGDRLPRKHPEETGSIKFIFVTDGYERAIIRARSAAGNKDVTIIGSADTTRECLKAGLVEELHLDIIPTFLQDGYRPFENLGTIKIHMRSIKVVEMPSGRIHMRFQLSR